jgi:hypothetical protein
MHRCTTAPLVVPAGCRRVYIHDHAHTASGRQPKIVPLFYATQELSDRGQAEGYVTASQGFVGGPFNQSLLCPCMPAILCSNRHLSCSALDLKRVFTSKLRLFSVFGACMNRTRCCGSCCLRSVAGALTPAPLSFHICHMCGTTYCMHDVCHPDAIARGEVVLLSPLCSCVCICVGCLRLVAVAVCGSISKAAQQCSGPHVAQLAGC